MDPGPKPVARSNGTPTQASGLNEDLGDRIKTNEFYGYVALNPK